MTTREKLIDLLTHGILSWESEGSLAFTDEFAAVIADHLIANGVTVQEWIPVGERLPEDEQERVLVKLETIGHMEIDTDRRLDGRWVRWQGTVTHWMPLPPPKGVE